MFLCFNTVEKFCRLSGIFLAFLDFVDARKSQAHCVVDSLVDQASSLCDSFALQNGTLHLYAFHSFTHLYDA